MSVGAICLTSSASTGGCWVLLVSPPPPLFFEKGVFFSYVCYAKKKRKGLRDINLKKFPSKKHKLRQKKSYAAYAKKRRVTLISAIKVCSPSSICTQGRAEIATCEICEFW